jgi:hypothetical protein
MDLKILPVKFIDLTWNDWKKKCAYHLKKEPGWIIPFIKCDSTAT